MTTYSYNYDIVETAASTNAINIVSGDDVYLAQGATVSASGQDSNGIEGVDHDGIIVAGDVFGSGSGILLNGTGTNKIVISSTGGVASSYAGLSVSGSNNWLTNAGTISGHAFGAAFDGGSTIVHNTGLIQGDYFAAISLGGSANKVVNAGDILSVNFAILGGTGADTVINKGLMVGDVSLGNGNDVLDSRGGIIEGAVDLGAGNDTAYGGDEADDINGDANDDLIRGKQDDDKLDGGNGLDKLIGGVGEDQFVFSTTLGATNVDTIADFTHGEDQIVLDAGIFAALGPTVGGLEFLAAASGHAALNANQHLIYDNSRGTLWYDVDGIGGTAAVKFAQLGTSADHPTNLTFADFAIG